MTTRGRPRNFVTQADKQKAYRERKKAEMQRLAHIEALRNSPPPTQYTWIKTDLVSPGTECMYCHLVIRWDDPKAFKWSKSVDFERYRYIKSVQLNEIWTESSVGAVCPACMIGRTNADHDRTVAILAFEGNPAIPPTNPFKKETWERAIAAGLLECRA